MFDEGFVPLGVVGWVLPGVEVLEEVVNVLVEGCLPRGVEILQGVVGVTDL